MAKGGTESKLRSELSLLGRPEDWGCPVRLIIRKYLNIREYEGRIYQDVFGRFDRETVYKALRDISDHRKSVSLELVRCMTALDEEQRVELFSATDEQYASLSDNSDLEIVDIMTAKKELYDYVISPSPRVERAYVLLTDRMEKALADSK